MISINHPDLERLVENHYQVICRYMSKPRTRNISEVEEILREYFPKLSFKSLIKARPDKLVELKKTWDSLEFSSKRKEDFQLFDTYFRYLNQNEPGFQNADETIYNAKTFIDNLGLSVCPYCNRNFIYNSSEIRSSEIDHFFPKSEYPFLAISFFNLIPCCKVCNRFKKDDIIGLNPYSSERVFSNLRFKVKINSTSFYYKTSGFDLSLIGTELNKADSEAFEIQKRVLDLEELYNHHKDIVLEHIQKGILYSDSYINELFENYRNTLFDERDDVLRLVYGNYLEDKDFPKRPLSKLSHDVAKQFEVK